MIQKIYLSLLFFLFVFSGNAFAIDSELERIYSKFIVGIERKYSPEVQNNILVNVRERVIELLGEPLTDRRRELLGDLDILNNEALFDLWLQDELSLTSQIAKENSIKTISDNLKTPYSQLTTEFQGYFTPNWKVQKVDDSYYGYNFNTFRYFESEYGVSNRDISASGISKASDIVFVNSEGRFNFVSDYTRHLIAKENNVYGLPEKQRFLDELRDDAEYPSQNIPTTLSEIKALTQSLTNGKNKQESIAIIYAWILENIEYTQVIDITDQQIFSGIEAFKTGSGVCTGYTKLMLYMLGYAGIHDVEVIRGHVIDAQDFPTIGHAWLRIGDRYYDPTFDDPLGARDTKTVEEYKFYGLPKDIFYANRFEYGDLPEYLETTSMDDRIALIFNNLTNLLPKYSGEAEDYLVFKPVLFYQKYNIPQGTNITVDYLSSKIDYYDVSEGEYSFQQNGVTKRISSYQYYPLTNDNILGVLDSLNYDLTGSYLFRWTLADGATEWRLAYDVEFR